MAPPRIDLDGDSLEALELGALLGWLADFARTAPGRREISGLAPGADAGRLEAELAAVGEAMRCLEEAGALVSALPDPASSIEALGVEGRVLDAGALRDLAGFADAASEVGRRLGSLDPAGFPRLRALGAELADLRAEAREVLGSVEPDGTLNDRASPELRRIRGARRGIAERLRSTLLRLLREPGAEAVVRDDFVTRRNGRFVIPVRTDAPRPVQGIVHATSSSGATQFVEPLEAVEPNNELVRLDELEQREIERLLGRWTAMFRGRREELARSLDVVARLDCLQARAAFARETAAVLPRVEPHGVLALREVRHPLLERRLREEGRGCVPLSLTLDPADRVLVLSGPNAGGKTVTLKTLGLAVLMAQAGIPLPATEARLPLYRQLRADIGDHQSIHADLSTFSAHVRAVSGFLRSATPPALLLIDEIGSGTEPAEGAALARAILDDLRRPGVTTVVTTHQGDLKAWGLTTPGAASAAMEFDPVELRPTYRVLMGTAGISAGLEIARRVGLAADVVERARRALGEGGKRTEALLERLRSLTAEVESARESLERQRAEVAAELRGVRAEAATERLRVQREAGRALDAALARFDREARSLLGRIRDRRERDRAIRSAARLGARMRGQHARLRQAVAPAPDDAAPALEQPRRLREGMEVFVRSLGRWGRVREVADDRVGVLLGQMPFTVRREDLRVRPGAGETDAAERPATPVSLSAGFVAAPAASELKLLGKTVDEALPELDKFLDAATLAGFGEVRVVHGHGTGRLRRAVRSFLDRHVHVAAHRPGRSHEGGDGATVVTLR